LDREVRALRPEAEERRLVREEGYLRASGGRSALRRDASATGAATGSRAAPLPLVVERRYYLAMGGDSGARPGAEAAGSGGAPRARLVYPVRSRRSGGLSIGVNLFPSGKTCSFDCPYCEVFASSAGAGAGGSAPASFSISRLEEELSDFLDRAWAAEWAPEPVRDLCLSGDGEPTLSPSLELAIAACDSARRARPGLLGGARLVLITNSTGFLDPGISSVLERAVDEAGLEIWAKLDAGSEELFRLMSGSSIPLDRLAEGILSFASRRPIEVQSMLCEVGGRVPSLADAAELGELLASLASRGARVSGVQAYTFARPTPRGGCSALGDDRLAELAAEIGARSGLRVRAFGARGEIAPGPGGAGRW
jgi:histidinol dehydrogenase